MKKTLIIFFLFFIKNSSIAQVDDPNFTPFAWGAGIGMHFCNANPHQSGLSNIERTPSTGFSFGAAASFRKRKLYLETGLEYRSEGYAYSSNVTHNLSVISQSNEYKFNSLLIPIKFVIPIHGTYCKHLPSLALNLSYALKEIHYQMSEDENAPLTKNVYNVSDDYRSISPSLTLAYGVEFDLDLNNAIRLEPNYQFTFLNAKSQENKTMIGNIGIKVYFLFLR